MGYGKTLSPLVLRLLLSYYWQSFLLISSALRPRFDIGSDVLSNTCLSTTIDFAQGAFVTLMSLVCKVLSLCESAQVQITSNKRGTVWRACSLSPYQARYLWTESSRAAWISNENLNVKRRSYEEVCKDSCRSHITVWTGRGR